jgi:UDP-N-acetylmuramyl pentapeptide phosphotransferase/UDP-N-acetylglucosamine-1-phosphate transferase
MLLSKDYLLLAIIILFSNIFLILLIKNANKKFLNCFLDFEFYKAQSFHSKPVLKIGGIFFFFFLILSNFFFSNLLLREIFYMSLPIFLFSILEDLKIKIQPYIRLIILFMIVFCIVKFFNLRIYSVQFYNIDKFLNSSQIYNFIFSTICIVFLINGSNFIDGFNGLLGLHSSIIIFILSIINYYYGNYDLFFLCILILVCLTIFLIFNFPNSRIFLGNSGSYLIGLILAILVILTSQKTQYHKVYPFFFACLLNYIFFEVFFSFFRKVFYEKKNPLYPDKKHLHMLVFASFKTHVKTTLIINSFYFVTLIVALFFFKSPGFLKVLFILQILLYIASYFTLLKKKN